VPDIDINFTVSKPSDFLFGAISGGYCSEYLAAALSFKGVDNLFGYFSSGICMLAKGRQCIVNLTATVPRAIMGISSWISLSDWQVSSTFSPEI
jgi:hypothetical protein